jgi:hypothetical protein
VLLNLADIINEYDISVRHGIYGWRVRHAVIADIVTKYKFHDVAEFIALFEQVIDNLSPTYEIEVRTINEICNFDTGLARIPDRQVQNRLLRRIISVAPGERVPRHRLIRNLIDDEQFDLAETEIRVFEKDLGKDGPVARYQVTLLVARALHTRGLTNSDRLVILDKAKALIRSAQERFSMNRSLYATFCDIGLHIYRLSEDRAVFDEALQRLKRAETNLGDPEITKMIRSYEKRMVVSVADRPVSDGRLIS